MVETLSRRKVDLCCVQETRYRDGHCCIIKGKESRYKLFWSGNSKGTAGVGVFVAEKWIEKVFEVKQVFDRIILVKIIVGQQVLCFLSVYAPQCGLSDSVMDIFYDQLRPVTEMIPASEFLIPCVDWNGHVGSTGSGYKEVHGGYGYGKVSKGAKIRNRYNQVPHLTQDTNGKVTNSQKTPQTRAKRSALSQQVTTKHI